MSKSEGKSDAKSEDKASSDSAASDGGASDTSSTYSRGENQKAVTAAYRKNWADVFGKKKRKARK